jgi:hypothetical protein
LGALEVTVPQFDVVDVQVRFHPASEGGRELAPSLDGTLASSYRPHLVVGGPDAPVHWPDGRAGMNYIGVAFVGGPHHVSVGETVEARFVFMFPEQDTAAVVPGAVFTLREGHHIVAEGRVVSRNVEELA